MTCQLPNLYQNSVRNRHVIISNFFLENNRNCTLFKRIYRCTKFQTTSNGAASQVQMPTVLILLIAES